MVGWPQRTILEKLVTSQGIDPPQQLVECGSMDFTKTLVASSDHLAMLPAHSVTTAANEETIKPLPITVSALNRNIAVIFRERLPLDSASQELITHIQAKGSELSNWHG